MLSFKGNTASYMLYSYARICSIARKAQIDRAALYDHSKFSEVKIETPQERHLLVTLLKLDRIILNMAADLMPHTLCDWMY